MVNIRKNRINRATYRVVLFFGAYLCTKGQNISMNDKRRHIMMLVEADASAGVSTDDFSKSLELSVAEKQKFLQSKEVRQLTMEKSKLQKQQVELKNQMTELEKQRQQAIKDAEEEIKHAREMKAKLDTFNVQQAKMAKDSEAQQAKVQKEMHDPERKELMIRRNFARMEEQDEAPTAPKKSVLVNFDKSTDQPFQVKFTERGFLIGDTRLSFEILEVAVSKEFNITLNNGTGLVLDAVRMQKILKYKDRV